MMIAVGDRFTLRDESPWGNGQHIHQQVSLCVVDGVSDVSFTWAREELLENIDAPPTGARIFDRGEVALFAVDHQVALGRIEWEFAAMSVPAEVVAAIIGDIAAEQLSGVTTLDTRNADHLDFHTLPIWQLRAALSQAFDAGQAIPDVPEGVDPAAWAHQWLSDAIDDGRVES